MFTTLKLNLNEATPWASVSQPFLGLYDVVFLRFAGLFDSVVVGLDLDSIRQAKLSRAAEWAAYSKDRAREWC